MGLIAISPYLWVLKEEEDKDGKTAAGIYIPGEAPKQDTGEVKFIGALCDKEVQKRIKLGDIIHFLAEAPLSRTILGVTYLLLKDTSITAVEPKE